MFALDQRNGKTVIMDGLADYLHSLVDCFWSPRPSRGSTPGRMDQGFLIYRRWCWHFSRTIFPPSLICTTTSKNNDQGMAGGDERISQGTNIPTHEEGEFNILTIA